MFSIWTRFINALLQADICRTAAELCTDIIQQIVYANEKFEQPINQHLQKVGLPLRILQNLSIVDTPDTNTIVEQVLPILANKLLVF